MILKKEEHYYRLFSITPIGWNVENVIGYGKRTSTIRDNSFEPHWLAQWDRPFGVHHLFSFSVFGKSAVLFAPSPPHMPTHAVPFTRTYSIRIFVDRQPTQPVSNSKSTKAQISSDFSINYDILLDNITWSSSQSSLLFRIQKINHRLMCVCIDNGCGYVCA